MVRNAHANYENHDFSAKQSGNALVLVYLLRALKPGRTRKIVLVSDQNHFLWF